MLHLSKLPQANWQEMKIAWRLTITSTRILWNKREALLLPLMKERALNHHGLRIQRQQLLEKAWNKKS